MEIHGSVLSTLAMRATARIGGLSALLSLLLSAVTASAQHKPERGEAGGNRPGVDGIDYQGDLRIGLATVLGSLVHTSTDAAAFGSTDVTTLRLGIVPSDLGLDLGYACLERLVAGARVQLSAYTASQRRVGVEVDGSGLSLALLPYLEYVLTPGQTLEWLGYGTLGLRRASVSAAGAGETRLEALAGVGGGLHVVVSESVSIDPVVEATYALGRTASAGRDADLSRLSVALRLGLSLWL